MIERDTLPQPPQGSVPARTRRRPITPIVFSVLLVVLGVAGCAGISSSSTSTDGTSSSTSSRAPAADYVRHHGQDVDRVQATVQSVLIAVGIAAKSKSIADANQVAQLAQQAHDMLDNVRDDFALDTTDSGRLGDAEAEVFAAANDLKNAMGALVAYAGNPNPASLAHFTSQYRSAVSEWNDGVRTIWRIARRRQPPTL